MTVTVGKANVVMVNVYVMMVGGATRMEAHVHTAKEEHCKIYFLISKCFLCNFTGSYVDIQYIVALV